MDEGYDAGGVGEGVRGKERGGRREEEGERREEMQFFQKLREMRISSPYSLLLTPLYYTIL